MVIVNLNIPLKHSPTETDGRPERSTLLITYIIKTDYFMNRQLL
jgi:hypothetical protein